MRKKILGTFHLLLATLPFFAQNSHISPYQFNAKKNATAITIGLGLSFGGHLLRHKAAQRAELSAAPLKKHPATASATGGGQPSADRASKWLLRGGLLLPLALFADADIRQDAGKIAVLGSETLLLTYGLTSLAKGTLRRNRSCVYHPEVPLENKLRPAPHFSFLSGHTSATASASFFTAKIWSDYHPDSKWKPAVWTAAAALPAVTGYLRAKAGKHQLSDVAAGYAVGALVGFFVPHFHKMKRGEKRKLRLSTAMVDEVPVFNLKYRF